MLSELFEDDHENVESVECTDQQSGNIMSKYSECTHQYSSQVYNTVTRISDA